MLVIGEIAQPVAVFESVLMMVAKAVAGRSLPEPSDCWAKPQPPV